MHSHAVGFRFTFHLEELQRGKMMMNDSILSKRYAKCPQKLHANVAGIKE